MISEWLKVMLEEISRKSAEAEQARIEEHRRCGEDSDLQGKTPHPGKRIPED
jgi:hypothetical protein